MTKNPRLTGKELVNLLKKKGFEVIRIRGSHYRLKDNNKHYTTVPVHSNDILGIGLLKKILKDCELKVEDIYN